MLRYYDRCLQLECRGLKLCSIIRGLVSHYGVFGTVGLSCDKLQAGKVKDHGTLQLVRFIAYVATELLGVANSIWLKDSYGEPDGKELLVGWVPQAGRIVPAQWSQCSHTTL